MQVSRKQPEDVDKSELKRQSHQHEAPQKQGMACHLRKICSKLWRYVVFGGNRRWPAFAESLWTTTYGFQDCVFVPPCKASHRDDESFQLLTLSTANELVSLLQRWEIALVNQKLRFLDLIGFECELSSSAIRALIGHWFRFHRKYSSSRSWSFNGFASWWTSCSLECWRWMVAFMTKLLDLPDYIRNEIVTNTEQKNYVTLASSLTLQLQVCLTFVRNSEAKSLDKCHKLEIDSTSQKQYG